MHFIPSINRLISRPFTLAYSVFIFMLPLALSRQTNELYEFPKTVFFYIFCILILAFFVSTHIFKPFKLKPIPVAFWLFPVMAFISTLLSSHPHTSFFGYYTRFADSLLFYVVLLVFYYVASITLKSEDLRTVFNVAQAGSIVLFFYALGQYSGAFSFLWKGQLQDRVFSTLGQPNWFAQYSLLLLGINFYGFLFKGRKSNLLFYTVQFFSLWLTFSMSGLAGFMALVLVNIFILICEKEKKLRISFYVKRLAVMFSISIFIAILFPGIFSGKVRDIFIDAQKMVYKVSVVQASGEEDVSVNLISDPAYIRSGLWSGTVNLIFSNPKVFIFGTGPETFPYSFQEYRPESLNYSSEWDFVLNKPHNYYLEIWAEHGLLGVLSYLYLLYFVLKNSEKKYKGGLAAFAVTNIFGWPTVVPAVLFWLMASSIGKERKKE